MRKLGIVVWALVALVVGTVAWRDAPASVDLTVVATGETVTAEWVGSGYEIGGAAVWECVPDESLGQIVHHCNQMPSPSACWWSTTYHVYRPGLPSEYDTDLINPLCD